jgi:predicted HicB family RNase H-like nuclease
VRLDDELAADTEALARAEGTSLNEIVKKALKEAVERLAAIRGSRPGCAA